jgi:hypothetical protein
MIHDSRHPLAGQTVKLALKGGDNPGDIASGDEYRVEDYWDRLGSGSWMEAQGNPAALKYAMRAGFSGLPLDDEVVYGKVGPFGHIVHISELVTVSELELEDQP